MQTASGIADRVNNLLRAIDVVTYSMKAVGQDISVIPPVRPSLAADGAVTLEWASADFRCGFTFEKVESESGWYFATSKRLGESGALDF